MLTYKKAREFFDYNQITGELTWRVQRNGKGKLNGPALKCDNGTGHYIGRVEQRSYLQHRVIWLWMTGAWPMQEIDHINGNGHDNRWANLRSVTPTENRKNQKIRSDNKSGQMGVYPHSKCDRWVAEITVDGAKRHLGLFADKDAAIAARKQAERQYGFHPNHGRKAS